MTTNNFEGFLLNRYISLSVFIQFGTSTKKVIITT